jgi:hypothetical protein
MVSSIFTKFSMPFFAELSSFTEFEAGRYRLGAVCAGIVFITFLIQKNDDRDFHTHDIHFLNEN